MATLLLGSGGFLAITRLGNGSMRLMGFVLGLVPIGMFIWWLMQDRTDGGFVVTRSTTRGCLFALLIGFGVLLLAVGMCAAMGMLSGPWPPR